MSDLFFWLGGGNDEVAAQCPGERTRITALGGTVLMTAILALLAGTSATHDWLHVPLLAALPAGIFWGLAIMNLDRWLLLTIRRQATPPRTLLLALPRLGLAVVVGLVVSTPLLLGIFHNEVSAKATEEKQAERASAQAALDTQFTVIKKLSLQQGALQKELSSSAASSALANSPDYTQLQRQLKAEQNRFDKAQREAICELDGTCGTEHAGAGPSYQAKDQEAGRLGASLAATKRKLHNLQKTLLAEARSSERQSDRFSSENLSEVNRELAEQLDQYKGERKKLNDVYGADIGLLDRVDALATLTSEHQSMRFIAILLALFVLTVDSVPVVFKTLTLLGRRSQYERIQDDIEDREITMRTMEEDGHEAVRRVEITSDVEEAQMHAKLQQEAMTDRLRQIADLEREVTQRLIPELRGRMMEMVPELADRYLQRQRMFWQASGTGSGGPGRNGGGTPGRPEDPSVQ